MHRIGRIEVDGFWENHNFSVDLHPDVNFFIGPNGTGKTTFINLIAAALLVDFPTLDKLSFRQIRLHLFPIGGKKKSTIIVTKPRQASRLGQINYEIKSDDGKYDQKFSNRDLGISDLFASRFDEDQILPALRLAGGENFAHAIREIINVGWLSVHRSSTASKNAERNRFESPVDRKLDTLSNALVRYFSTLSKQKDDEVLKFQQTMFLSLLHPPKRNLQTRPQKSATLDTQKSAVEQIFEEIHIPKDVALKAIDDYFTRITTLQKKVKSTSPSELRIEKEELNSLLDLERIQQLIKDWQDLEAKKSAIFGPKENFKLIVNQMLQRKRMEVSESNELVFISRSGKVLTPQMLSSGEKQLLILLSETLLQRQEPFVFIADEPEISLHVLWQERLISSLRELNDSAQIIAATHSPDIVGSLASRTFNMEDLIP